MSLLASKLACSCALFLAWLEQLQSVAITIDQGAPFKSCRRLGTSIVRQRLELFITAITGMIISTTTQGSSSMILILPFHSSTTKRPMNTLICLKMTVAVSITTNSMIAYSEVAVGQLFTQCVVSFSWVSLSIPSLECVELALLISAAWAWYLHLFFAVPILQPSLWLVSSDSTLWAS